MLNKGHGRKVDTALSATSKNPVTNSAVYSNLSNLQSIIDYYDGKTCSIWFVMSSTAVWDNYRGIYALPICINNNTFTVTLNSALCFADGGSAAINLTPGTNAILSLTDGNFLEMKSNYANAGGKIVTAIVTFNKK